MNEEKLSAFAAAFTALCRDYGLMPAQPVEIVIMEHDDMAHEYKINAESELYLA